MKKNDDSSNRPNTPQRSASSRAQQPRPQESQEQAKDNWDSLAENLDQEAQRDAWNNWSEREESTNQTRPSFESPASRSELRRSSPPYYDNSKIDEDYETRARNRTRSVWNRGEWSYAERDESEQPRRYRESYPRERPGGDYDASDRRMSYRPDYRNQGRAEERAPYRDERYGYEREPRGDVDDYHSRGFTGLRRRPRSYPEQRPAPSRRREYRGDYDAEYASRFPYGRKPEETGWSKSGVSRERRPKSDYAADSRGRTRDASSRAPQSSRDASDKTRKSDVRRYGRRNLEPTIGILGKRGEPLSLAEELVARRYRRSKASKFARRDAEAPKTNDPAQDPKLEELDATSVEQEYGYDASVADEVVKLKKLSMQELVVEARRQKLETIDGEKRRDLILRVLRKRITDNALQFGEGTLEILPDEFGFLRSPKANYTSSLDDIYISPSQIRLFGLRTGLTIFGQIRPPKEKERYFALLRVELINDRNPNELISKPYFDDLLVARSSKRLLLSSPEPSLEKKDKSTNEQNDDLRVVDLVAPIAFGQRALIISPATDNVRLTRKIVNSITTNYPDVFVFVLLVGKTPEEIEETGVDLNEKQCEVVSSSFDESALRHIDVSEIVFEKAKRMVEYGRNVVLIIDSIANLVRAWNTERASRETFITGCIDPLSIQRPKKIFGSSRQIDAGGSLTVLAFAQLNEANEFDQEVVKQFKEITNTEIVLNAKPNADGNFTVSAKESFTRDVRDFMDDDAVRAYKLLKEKIEQDGDASQFLSDLIAKTKTTAEAFEILSKDSK